MAKASRRKVNKSLINGIGRKCTSTGVGGRGRKTKVAIFHLRFFFFDMAHKSNSLWQVLRPEPEAGPDSATLSSC